jgi:branched-chain amino acid transport system substrate-binding protein
MLRFACASLGISLALAACVAPPPPPPPLAVAPAPGLPAKHIAILAPLTGPRSDLGAALVNGAHLALDVPGAPVLDVRDTFGTPEGAAAAARAAIASGDVAILGPLTAAETAAVAAITQPAGIPVLAFTNDSAQSRRGVWTMGVTPSQQVRRLVQLLRDRGKVHIAGLLPHSNFGHAMEAGLSDATIEFRLPPPSLREYAPDSGSIAAALAGLASQTAPPSPGAPAAVSYDALLLADIGPGLAMVADALPAAGVPDSVQIVGPALWGSPVSGASRLAGAWYAAADPSLRARYEDAYRQKYGSPPPAISDLAYDAAGIARVAVVSGPSAIAAQSYAGADGPLQLLPDGHVRRGLAVFELQASGPARLIAPPLAPGA